MAAEKRETWRSTVRNQTVGGEYAPDDTMEETAFTRHRHNPVFERCDLEIPEDSAYSIRVSFFEIYNNNIKDLLAEPEAEPRKDWRVSKLLCCTSIHLFLCKASGPVAA